MSLLCYGECLVDSTQLWRGPAVASEATADGRWMHLVWITLIGLVAGLAGRLVTAGKKGPFGFMLTILLGIIGAFMGPYLGQAAGWYSAEEPAGLVAAMAGAVLVVSIWAVLFRSGRPTSSL